MDRNLLLAFALSFVVLSTWSMWQRSPVPPTAHTAGEAVEDWVEPETAPSARQPERFRDLPSIDPVAPPPRSREVTEEAPSG